MASPSLVSEALAAAIRSRRVVAFMYGAHPRLVEPHTLGVLHGEPMLLAYQLEGRSSSGPLPDWRLFSLAKMEDLDLRAERFGARPPQKGGHVRWDRVLAFVPSPP